MSPDNSKMCMKEGYTCANVILINSSDMSDFKRMPCL